ncbi:hypothetical protein CSUI_004508, partial [Cystoisospora suis]
EFFIERGVGEESVSRRPLSLSLLFLSPSLLLFVCVDTILIYMENYVHPRSCKKVGRTCIMKCLYCSLV